MKRNQRKRTNKRLLTLMKLVMALGILVGGGLWAYAASTSREEKINDFQVGNVSTSIEEVFTPTTEIKPNQPVKKEVTFTNDGTINQFLRVMIHPEVRAAIVGDPANQQVLPVNLKKEVQLDLNTTDWRDGGDGYYYYLKALKPGQPTSKLFTKVTLNTSLPAVYDGGEFVMKLKVESINCAEYAYRDAWWNGQTPSIGAKQAIDNALKLLVDQ